MASIRKRGNSYQITVSNGRDSSGKQLLETTTFTPDPSRTEKQNQKALEKFVFEFEEKVKSGKYLDGEKMTLNAFAKKWLNEYAPEQLEKTSLANYKQVIEQRILPALGHITIAKLSPVQILAFYNSLLKDGCRLDGRPGAYSPATIKKTHVCLSSMLSTAVQWQIIEDNPCSRVKAPRQAAEPDKVKSFDLDQTKRFLAHLENYSIQYQALFNIALFGGLRKGEILGLTWNDVDFKTGCVSISKSVGEAERQIVVKQPKTASSVRTVSLSGEVMTLLKRHRAEQMRKKLAYGTYWTGEGNYIFTQEDGSIMHPSTPYHAFKKICNSYNEKVSEGLQLPDISLHGLRHTSATLLIASNIDVKTVSSRLGHAKVSTTLNIYSHSLTEKDKTASDTLSDILKVRA